MKKVKLSRKIGTLMAIAILVANFGAANVYAAEAKETTIATVDSEVVEPRAGVETLPLGWYTISSSFSITGHNYTPVKTVQGRYMKLNFSCKVNPNSIGLRGVQITIRLRDYNTKEFIPGAYYTYTLDSNDTTYILETSIFDLGYAGRKVQIYTNIDSLHVSDPATRTVNFMNYRSYVSN